MNAVVKIPGLSPEQQLEALHRLWDEQQEIWDKARAGFAARLSTMFNENRQLGDELRTLVEERDALLAAPSKLFQPQLHGTEARQAERAAFAAGLHHATTMQRRAAVLCESKARQHAG